MLPLAQPFNDEPWDYEGNEAFLSSNDLPVDMVDWVLLELRNPLDYTEVIGQAAGILLSDGRVVSHEDASEGVFIKNVVPNRNYYLIVRSRSHLDVMSKTAVYMSTQLTYDFSRGVNRAYGSNQMKFMEAFDPGPLPGDEYNVFALYSGDYNGDGSSMCPTLPTFTAPRLRPI